MLDDLKKGAAARMQKCVQAFQADLKKLRTGRAHPSLIEHLKVDYYGSDVPLQQVANISVEDARTLVVSPWEKTMVGPIEKAIHKSELGLTPNTAGAVIRIPLPPLTEERRRDITKVVRQDAENARVSVRSVRRDALADIKEMLKEKLVSQDDERRGAGRDPEAHRPAHRRDRSAAGGQGKGNSSGLSSAATRPRVRLAAAPRGHRHGWQRALGARARRCAPMVIAPGWSRCAWSSRSACGTASAP